MKLYVEENLNVLGKFLFITVGTHAIISKNGNT